MCKRGSEEIRKESKNTERLGVEKQEDASRDGWILEKARERVERN